MKAMQQDFYMAEIKKCRRLYGDFKEAAPFLEAVVEAVTGYIESHGDEFKPFDYAYAEEDASNEMRSTRSLGLNPKLNRNTVLGLFGAISGAVSRSNPAYRKPMKEALKKLEQFTENSPHEISREEYNALPERLIKETALEKDMATFLFSMVISTIYRRQLEPISEVLRTDLWEGGNCPLCGEKPHFGRFRPEDGAKELECWLCGTGWVHTRIKCPYCDNDEQEELGYFTVEDSEICRVNFCNLCRRYYKVFDVRKFDADDNTVLTIHNLATLDYDLLAGGEGFTPGSGLEWVDEGEIKKRQA